MAATKSYAALTWSSGSATTSGNTNWVAVSTYYASTLFVKIVVVGTPSAAPSFVVVCTLDYSTIYLGPSFSTPLVAGTYYWQIQVDPTAPAVLIAYTAQTGGTSSTLTAQIGYITGV